MLCVQEQKALLPCLFMFSNVINNMSNGNLFTTAKAPSTQCACAKCFFSGARTRSRKPSIETIDLESSFKSLILACLLFCCSGRIPRLSLNQHSLYVGVVEKPPPPPLTGEHYGKLEQKYP